MKGIRYIIIGILFGVVMYKSQAVSWYRIFEMFRFESFHMFGIIGTALFLGIITVQSIKRYQIKSRKGQAIMIAPKNKSIPRYLIGGIIFGLGWALAGACPGPMYVLIGSGDYSVFIVVAAALVGTFTYGLLRTKLPH